MAKAQAGSRAASRAGAAQVTAKAAPKAAAQTASEAPKAARAAQPPQPKPARAKSERAARPEATAEAAIDAKLEALFDAAPAPAEDRRVIAIRGAREHNLKNVDLTIPRDKLVVFTGLSGSGKSSLAFDTIYAEGQRR